MREITLTGLVSNVVVVLGLVFVGLEIQQNTDAVKGATIQALAEMSQANTLAGLENPDLREAYMIVREFGPDSLNRAQLDLLGWYTTASLRVMENRFHQVELGTLDDLSTAGGGEPFFRTLWFRGWWARNGAQAYGGTPFFEFVESELMTQNELPLSPFGQETHLPIPGEN